eukprot:c4243_g1_i1.p1 GENE.c4243_g1_i1~~c4243_g1_i1.p1  ORF type:complete len:397 (+),score=121.58 c4243_g1_i1:43-1233(+)
MLLQQATTVSDEYLLTIDSLDQIIAIGDSGGRVSILDTHSLTTTTTVTAHQTLIRQATLVRFQNSPMLATCGDEECEDGALLWDLRDPSKSKVSMASGAPVFAVASRRNDNEYAIAQREKVGIWDIRKRKMVRSFQDIHSDTVTCVMFPSHSNNTLITASEDGLCCVLDLSQRNDDDALISVFNGEQSVTSIGMLSSNVLHVLSDLSTLSLWDVTTEDRIAMHSNIRESTVLDKWKIDYITRCVSDANSRLLAICGTFRGVGIVLEVEKQSTRALCAFGRGGHNKRIRDCCWVNSDQQQQLATVGEDGRICVWRDRREGEAEEVIEETEEMEEMEEMEEEEEEDERDESGRSEESESEKAESGGGGDDESEHSGGGEMKGNDTANHNHQPKRRRRT